MPRSFSRMYEPLPSLAEMAQGVEDFVVEDFSEPDWPKWRVRSAQAASKIAFYTAIAPLVLTFRAFRRVSRAAKRVHAELERQRVRRVRLPQSKPLVQDLARDVGPVVPGAAAGSGRPSQRPPAASFASLPPEIRLFIYELAGVPATGVIIQVTAGPSDSRIGPAPAHWRRGQRIRSDSDPPSKALYDTLSVWGGGPLNQNPRQRGVCVQMTKTLLCGGEWRENWSSAHGWSSLYDLMPVSRLVYADMLHLLYGNNTVSLFGADLLRFLVRNASPEGLRLVRNVHVALLLPSARWQRHRSEVAGAVALLRSRFPALRQLDVELVLRGGQPPRAGQFWTWLMGDEGLGGLRGLGLQDFVLKAVCHSRIDVRDHKGHTDGWCAYGIERLGSWSGQDYRALKSAVMAGASRSMQ